MVERILDEAARLFDDCGYGDVTTNHVAEAAGVSVGSLYQYFPNKDALLVGLAERHLDDVAPRLADLAAELRVAAPTVSVVCERFISAVADLNSSSRLHSLLWAAPRTPALVERLTSLEDVLVAEVAWHLDRLGHPPELAPVRARILVKAVDAAIHGLGSAADRLVQLAELNRLAELYVGAR